MGNFILGFICCFVLIAILVCYACLVVGSREARREEQREMLRVMAEPITDISPPPDIERPAMQTALRRNFGSHA